MPIIWRYLLAHYLKVLSLAAITFIALLFVSRLQQLAHFAALGAGMNQVALFALFLIPYILPIALPIACLISAIILSQRLSHSSELTAMRASGLGLRQILTPLLLAASFFSILNFYVTSELATHCHLLGKKMQNEQATVNPLALLQNRHLLAGYHTFADMRTTKSGEEAKDVTLVTYSKPHGRLAVLQADKLWLDKANLHGHNVSVVTTSDSKQLDQFDHLAIEYSESMTTPLTGFSHLMESASWQPKNSHLRLQLLLKRIEMEGESVKAWSEVIRRVSLALAAFTFTLMGLAFGTEIGRRHSPKGVIYGVLLSAFFIAAFLVAGSITSSLLLAGALYLVPHGVIIFLSLNALRRASMGVV